MTNIDIIAVVMVLLSLFSMEKNESKLNEVMVAVIAQLRADHT